MRFILMAAALACGVAYSAEAAVVTATPASTFTLPSGSGAYSAQNLAGNPDPWVAGVTQVGVGNSFTFNVADSARVRLVYRGAEAGFKNELALGAGGAVLFKHRSTPVGSLLDITVGELKTLVFESQGKASQAFGIGSERVAATVFANVISFGFNDVYAGDADFDDLRVDAIVTPLPAALPLMATALAGFGAMRRWRRSGR